MFVKVLVISADFVTNDHCDFFPVYCLIPARASFMDFALWPAILLNYITLNIYHLESRTTRPGLTGLLICFAFHTKEFILVIVKFNATEDGTRHYLSKHELQKQTFRTSASLGVMLYTHPLAH